MIRKICFTASSGGHLEEISRLKEIERNYDSFLLTEENHFCELKFCRKVYYTKQLRRHEIWFPVRYLILFIRSFCILLKEKPDCIISTGALVTFPICLLGKILGKKIIYIESFARVDRISTTGRWMEKIADLFIVQWEELLQFIPDAVYGGSLFFDDENCE